MWTCTLLNTLTLAMTCSTYYQLCGNGGIREGLQDSSFLHEAVCGHWLSPISTTEYPNFSAWMLYGEAAGSTAAAAAAHSKPAAARSSTFAPSPRGGGSGGGSSSSSIFNASFWWGAAAPSPPPLVVSDPFGLGPFNASQIAELVSSVPQGGTDSSSSGSVISPVFTMWITLVALYIGAHALMPSNHLLCLLVGAPGAAQMIAASSCCLEHMHVAAPPPHVTAVCRELSLRMLPSCRAPLRPFVVDGPVPSVLPCPASIFCPGACVCVCNAVNVLADHVAAYNMSARHISELRRDFVPDPDIALLAQLSTAAGITLRWAAVCWRSAPRLLYLIYDQVASSCG